MGKSTEERDTTCNSETASEPFQLVSQRSSPNNPVGNVNVVGKLRNGTDRVLDPLFLNESTYRENTDGLARCSGSLLKIKPIHFKSNG